VILEGLFTPADFITVALVALEGLLSADNAWSSRSWSWGWKEQQRKALRYGIVGASGFHDCDHLTVYLIGLAG
jgi:predicted tellurium resistance membrane protein TerC